MKKLVIGIWLGYDKEVNLEREGIGRYIQYLINSLSKNFEINFEIWVSEVNFQSINKKYSGYKNVKVYSEKSFFFGRIFYFIKYFQVFFEKIQNKRPNILTKSLKFIFKILKKLFPFKYLLPNTANLNSKAKVFFIPIISLDNSLNLKSKKVLAALDLFPVVYKDLYVDKYHFYTEIEANNLIKIAERFIKKDTFFVSNSKSILKEHFYNNLKNLNIKKTEVIYLPANIPNNLNVISKEKIMLKFNLNNKYIYYPTQSRPHKNIMILLKALLILNNNSQGIDFVTTGDLINYFDLKNFYLSNLKERVHLIGAVEEDELYSLYKYAEMCVVTTFAEGGFPWQTLEAIYMGCPVITSDIPVLRERLAFHNISVEQSGLILFNPKDENDLVKKILYVKNNRQKVINQQKKLKELLLAYTWDDAAKEYLKLFTKVISS